MRFTDLKKAAFIPVCLAALASIGTSLPVSAELAAALLPSSRSTEVGNTVTVFSTVINAGSTTATACEIGLVSASPLALSYQTTDSATNLPNGVANTPVDISAGAAQSFVLSITPMAVIDSAEIAFSFTCASGATAGTIAGVNTLLLSASDTPVVDVIALSATPENNGLLALDDSIGAFSLATINLGAADTVSVAADTGDSVLPVTLNVCETNATSGLCLADPSASVLSSLEEGSTPTFSVFSSATGAIANDPANNRIFVRFTDSNNIVRGGTSVAIENQVSAAEPALSGSAIDIFSRISTVGNDSDIQFVAGADGQINAIIPCGTGQIVVSGVFEGDELNSSSTVTQTFENCDGLNGEVTVVSTNAVEGTIVSFDVVQNGSFSSEECSEVTSTDLRTSGTIDTDEELSDDDLGNLQLNTSGTISGICEGVTFTCSLDDFDVLNEDASGIEDICST